MRRLSMRRPPIRRLPLRRPGLVAAVALAGVALVLLAGCEAAEGPPLARWGKEVDTAATTFTVRLPAADPETQAVVITQTVYPVSREENAVGAIILAPQDEATAFLAMHRITHMPVNAPLLYLDAEGRLGAATRREMERLRPDGVMQDGQVQVYVLGDVDPSVAETVRRELGYQVRTLAAADPFALAELVDRWQAALKSDHPDEVVISALGREGMQHGIGAMGWNAHMGRGFAWVTRDEVPAATRRILERRLGLAYIYLMGDEQVISPAVERELARYGVVRRLRGANPFATNAMNAGYKDFGRNVGWWWSEAPRTFGWGIAQAGHNFIVGSADDLLGVIASSVLGHMGKHGPILLVEPDRVPPETADYLRMVQPSATNPRHTILNFAWVIGDTERVSWEVQQELTRLLAPATGSPAAARPGAEPQEGLQEGFQGSAADGPQPARPGPAGLGPSPAAVTQEAGEPVPEPVPEPESEPRPDQPAAQSAEQPPEQPAEQPAPQGGTP